MVKVLVEHRLFATIFTKASATKRAFQPTTDWKSLLTYTCGSITACCLRNYTSRSIGRKWRLEPSCSQHCRLYGQLVFASRPTLVLGLIGTTFPSLCLSSCEFISSNCGARNNPNSYPSYQQRKSSLLPVVNFYSQKFSIRFADTKDRQLRVSTS